MKSVFDELRDVLGTARIQNTAIMQLIPMICGECGTPYAIEATLHENLLKTGQTFYCPNGHQRYFGESEADKLRKQLAQEAKRREILESQVRDARTETEMKERQRRAAKGQLTKERKRIANGVCPCCNRSFANLHRHMTTEHPDYMEKEN